jgi:hypothetical protein
MGENGIIRVPFLLTGSVAPRASSLLRCPSSTPPVFQATWRSSREGQGILPLAGFRDVEVLDALIALKRP